MTDGPITSEPPPIRRGRLRVVAGILSVLAILAGLLVSADVLWQGRLYKADPLIARRIYVLMCKSPGGIHACAAVTQLGGLPFSLAVGVTVAGVLALLRRWPLLAVWVLGLLGSAGLNVVMKIHFGQPRPDLFSQFQLDDGYTYPSGHIMAAVTTFGLMAYILGVESPRWRWLWAGLAGVLVAGVGASLLLIGVHYVTDLLGGLAMACGWLFLVIALLGGEVEREVGVRLRGRWG